MLEPNDNIGLHIVLIWNEVLENKLKLFSYCRSVYYLFKYKPKDQTNVRCVDARGNITY